ncbi:unnamed protein product, partial [Rotaria socialis]
FQIIFIDMISEFLPVKSKILFIYLWSSLNMPLLIYI